MQSFLWFWSLPERNCRREWSAEERGEQSRSYIHICSPLSSADHSGLAACKMAFRLDTSASSSVEATQESNLPSAELADAVGPEAELLGLDLLSVPVVLVVLAAGIPPAAHGVGAWEGEGSGGGLLGGGIPGVQCIPTQGRPVLSGPRLQGRLGLLVPLLYYLSSSQHLGRKYSSSSEKER